MMFDAQHNPYKAKRQVTYSKNGMVATSQPLAAEAGLTMLKKGGNAVDAAIATAACLTVTEPTSNGIGSDAFALVWIHDDKKLYGLNGSGPAPEALSIDVLKEKGITEEMPAFGWTPVTVPGTPAAWAELSRRFGKLPFKELFEPAIRHARDGYPLSPVLAFFWNNAAKRFKETLTSEEFSAWFETFAPGGEAPQAGDLWQSEGHAKTLEAIAKTDAKAFYSGELADRIDAASRAQGGYLRKEDLTSFQPEWVEPVSVNYKGYDVWEIPPNGQGMIALMALKTLQDDTFATRDTDQTFHYQIEAMKQAFTDGLHYITEPSDMTQNVSSMLSDSYARERRSEIKGEAMEPKPGDPSSSGTVYLAAADKDGNMVSFIQSNYMGFGSGVVVPGTGIALQNRGHNFSLDPTHDNALKPGKRTYHTIIPGFMTKGDEAVGPFGVMGGFMQPQGHMQMVMNTVDFKLNPQAALDAPRWQWLKGKSVQLEQTVPEHIVNGLLRRGHKVEIAAHDGAFGRGQIIWRDPKTGVLAGGTESRTDGAIAVY
ncbi:gamma-glutamyltransferase family protein [Salisediminibacterium selenitireducens]|uniref:Gamma-glutamyltransferase n=1 Tax=Bacillus selenitireducens (strain ATCC 700615 / DSM 15326 / MLS10) TaxID=439292 RepID=D6XYG3_BACIE|nr:Gamma-glutamyltransferase [[Bacillus] selenitireducens MLS10]